MPLNDVRSSGQSDKDCLLALLGMLVADPEVTHFLHLGIDGGGVVPVSCRGCPFLPNTRTNGARFVQKGDGEVVDVYRVAAGLERVELEFRIKREGVRGEIVYELHDGRWKKSRSWIVEEK